MGNRKPPRNDQRLLARLIETEVRHIRRHGQPPLRFKSSGAYWHRIEGRKYYARVNSKELFAQLEPGSRNVTPGAAEFLEETPLDRLIR
jgi:hypothetical protein